MTRAKKAFIYIITVAIGALIIVVGINWETLIREYRFWELFEYIETNKQGLKEYRHRKSGIVMVELPKGTLRKSDTKKIGWLQFPKYKLVKMESFLIAKYEVSQETWEKVMGSNPSNPKDPKLPVNNITFKECVTDSESFCNKVGLKLPTEDQWEYACRAGTQTQFSFGSWIKPDQVNCDFSSPASVPPESAGSYLILQGIKFLNRNKPKANPPKAPELMKSGSFPPNPWGLHDMHGNVAEICDSMYVTEENPDKTTPDILKPTTRKVIRGGAFNSAVPLCTSVYRFMLFDEWKEGDTGFRPIFVFETNL